MRRKSKNPRQRRERADKPDGVPAWTRSDRGRAGVRPRGDPTGPRGPETLLIAYAMQHLALIGVARRRLRDAARLLGYVDETIRQGRVQARAHREVELREAHGTPARRSQGRRDQDAAADGAAWTEDQAVAEALKI